MILIGGASDTNQDGTGAFQEASQVCAGWSRGGGADAVLWRRVWWLRPDGSVCGPSPFCRVQLEYARPYCKYVARPGSVERIPFFIEQAVRYAINGRPGAVYIDIPGTLVTGTADDVVFPPMCPAPPRTLAPLEAVGEAAAVLRTAERPLIIVGKGAAYARAEAEVREAPA